MKYLMILLGGKSASYCHYENNTDKNDLMSAQLLQKGILYAMKHNMSINYIYPREVLTEETEKIIESFYNKKIKPYPFIDNADIIVTGSIKELEQSSAIYKGTTICRLGKEELFNNHSLVCRCLNLTNRTNLVITDIESFTDDDFNKYKAFLNYVSENVDIEHHKINVLSDRLEIDEMNNCNAGVNNITLAPDGNFYICPGFYYSEEPQNVGNIKTGLNIKNPQLYQIEYAPICRHCDAYHCKRCIWLNQKTTLEVNTPSHEQCVVSHLERNTTKQWLLKQQTNQGKYKDINIKELNYLDPFEEYKNWK